MKHSCLILAFLFVSLAALPAAGQTFKRRPGKDAKATETQPDRQVTALPVIEGDPVDLPKDRISVEGLKQKVDAKEDIIILDVRGLGEYRAAQTKIQGAVHIPLFQIEERFAELPKDKEIVTYCSCLHEATSGKAAETLLAKGFKNVKALVGGFDQWEAAGYPVEYKDNRSK